MSTLKVDAIRHNSATSDAITTASDGTCTAKLTSVGGGQLSHRNLIINGDYRIAQRATSSTTNGYQTMDRWYQYANNTGVTVTVAQVAITSGNAYDDGFRKAAKISLSGAGTANSNGEIEIFQKIEAQDIANSGWNYKSSSSKITLSFWVKSSTAQTFPVHLRTEGGSNYGYGFTYTVTQANVWQKISHSIAGNSNLVINDDNASGFRVYAGMPFQGSGFDGGSADTWVSYSPSTRVPPVPDTWLTAGASTFEITGVQLEVGDTATSFEHRSFGEELLRCQRYYQQFVGLSDQAALGFGRSNGTTIAECNVPLSVPLRASPSLNSCNWAVFTATNQVAVNNTTPSVRKWDAYSNMLAIGIAGLSGMTNARTLTVFLNSGHTFSMNAEL